MVFTLGPSAHLRFLATGDGFGVIFSNACTARFVQGGVVKTFRYFESAQKTTLFPAYLIHKTDRKMELCQDCAKIAPSVHSYWDVSLPSASLLGFVGEASSAGDASVKSSNC